MIRGRIWEQEAQSAIRELWPSPPSFCFLLLERPLISWCICCSQHTGRITTDNLQTYAEKNKLRGEIMICNPTSDLLIIPPSGWRGRPPLTSPRFTSEQLAPEQERAWRWHMWLRSERCGRVPDDDGMRMGGGKGGENIAWVGSNGIGSWQARAYQFWLLRVSFLFSIYSAKIFTPLVLFHGSDYNNQRWCILMMILCERPI